MRQYETYCQALTTELDVSPTPETVQLYEAIKTKRLPLPVKPALAQSASQPTPAVQSAAARPPQIAHHLPPQATPFLGREAELAELEQLIMDAKTRLVTIVGAGGMGETRWHWPARKSS